MTQQTQQTQMQKTQIDPQAFAMQMRERCEQAMRQVAAAVNAAPDDQRMTGALLDRLTHHVHIVAIEGDSFRLKTSVKKADKKGDQQTQTNKGGDPPQDNK